ncbi:hypothetical protein PG984_015718 [Apiospora sp. TS-2023a]
MVEIIVLPTCTASCWLLPRLTQEQDEYPPAHRWEWGSVVESHLDAKKMGRLACAPKPRSLRDGEQRVRQFSVAEKLGAMSHAGRSGLLDLRTGSMDIS